MAEVLRRRSGAAMALVIGFVAVVALMYLFWPAGVALGLIGGVVVVFRLGLGMQQDAATDAVVGATPLIAAADEDADVRAELQSLKDRLGDGYPDFARAATLVVDTQYASASRLQRDLHVPYARARRLLTDLESQRFVGPATGPVARQVLLSRDHLSDLERLLAEA
ncbi:DNA translocase FtsK [uncultured Amnibacterium sp.]|uniref:DNA translocase FtsK n=1 Tax=uncultured Amnibacterium sp. TaxID=1631851 RepID=UPI0035CB3609